MVWKVAGVVYSNKDSAWFQLVKSTEKAVCLNCSLYSDCYQEKVWSLGSKSWFCVNTFCSKKKGHHFRTLQLITPFKRRRF